MVQPQRKPTRLASFNYNSPGAYFLTICTHNRTNLLCRIVGGGPLDAPTVVLSTAGTVAQQCLLSGNRLPGMHIDKYVIMPNHIHLIVFIDDTVVKDTSPANARIPHFISTFKRFCHKQLKAKIFQRSYHDHVIRNEKDYLAIWEYIDNNPAKWAEDCFYDASPTVWPGPSCPSYP